MNRAVEFVLIAMFDISDMRKSFNDHLDKIEKQTVEEMVSVEQNLQVQLKNVLVSMEAKRTDFDHIRQDVNTVKKYASGICSCNSTSLTRLVLQCFSVTDTSPNLETSFTKDSNSDGKSSFNS
jgi:hypothetical protein